MKVIHRLQIHQYNDPEILEFFINYGVGYRLVGDHLFIICSRKNDVAAGPGDWLVVASDGEVEVERGERASGATGDFEGQARTPRAEQGSPRNQLILGLVGQ